MENPDADSGLYIRDRNGRIVRATIPADHIAYQMGEAMQVCPVIIGRSNPSLGPGWLRAKLISVPTVDRVLINFWRTQQGRGFWQPLPAACLLTHLASFGRNSMQFKSRPCGSHSSPKS
jgi:hypothetical protein